MCKDAKHPPTHPPTPLFLYLREVGQGLLIHRGLGRRRRGGEEQGSSCDGPAAAQRDQGLGAADSVAHGGGLSVLLVGMGLGRELEEEEERLGEGGEGQQDKEEEEGRRLVSGLAASSSCLRQHGRRRGPGAGGDGGGRGLWCVVWVGWVGGCGWASRRKTNVEWRTGGCVAGEVGHTNTTRKERTQKRSTRHQKTA